MGKIPDIWSEKTEVRFGKVDRSDRLTLWSIFDLFQEAAISHAENLGVGRDALSSNGQAWILSRLSLIAERRPRCGETVEINTWPRKWDKLFALRDYTIRDEEGNAVVRGRGSWLVFDTEKRRPLRPQTVVGSLPANDGIDAFPAGAAALGPRENLLKIMDRTALYSDIDFYGHANNARYIQWIQDAADIDILTAASKIRLDINYLSEAKPGDMVEILGAPLDDFPSGADYPSPAGPGFAFEGRRPVFAADEAQAGGSGSIRPGQPVFRAELRTSL